MNKVNTVYFTVQEILILYNQDQTLHLYKTGGDLFDFDAFLTHLVPDVDLELIDHPTAMALERSLYSMLASCTTQKACLAKIGLFSAQLQNRFAPTWIQKLMSTKGLLSLKAGERKKVPAGIRLMQKLQSC